MKYTKFLAIPLCLLFFACNQQEVLNDQMVDHTIQKSTKDNNVYIADGLFTEDPTTYDGPINQEVENDICDKSVVAPCFIIKAGSSIVSVGDTVEVEFYGSSDTVAVDGIVDDWLEDNNGNVTEYDVDIL